jgi:hypothetical protein
MARERVNNKDKIHPKAPLLDLEMMGKGRGDWASWWEGRMWAEMRLEVTRWKPSKDGTRAAKERLASCYDSGQDH